MRQNDISVNIRRRLAKSLEQHSDLLYVKAPGRINLIGEHTDYNKGLVLPAAIDKYIYISAASNGSRQIYATALDLDQQIIIDLDHLEFTDFLWANFLIGILIEFKKRGVQLHGFDCSITSDLPVGAGMSSSSALECAFLVSLQALWSTSFDKWELINISQASNHNFLGIKGGIMDQFASLYGQADKVMLLDCQTLEHTYIDLPETDYTWLLINTCVKHNHLTSGYNDRVSECKAAIQDIQKIDSEVKHLCDIADIKKLIPINFRSAKVKSRASYVISENLRVKSFVKKLQEHDLQACGTLLYASHQGLSRDYEVSCEELDFLVEQLQKVPEVLGSRMMGGGFGGCTINLVKKDYIPALKVLVSAAYLEKFGQMPEYYEVQLSDGARVVS